ncbi:MAG: hypothetical protein IPG29_16820 [Sphingobacteriales bacterium]|nr:hypothetical protein [Sphingobacteriales bacterium]
MPACVILSGVLIVFIDAGCGQSSNKSAKDTNQINAGNPVLAINNLALFFLDSSEAGVLFSLAELDTQNKLKLISGRNGQNNQVDSVTVTLNQDQLLDLHRYLSGNNLYGPYELNYPLPKNNKQTQRIALEILFDNDNPNSENKVRVAVSGSSKHTTSNKVYQRLIGLQNWVQVAVKSPSLVN